MEGTGEMRVRRVERRRSVRKRGVQWKKRGTNAGGSGVEEKCYSEGGFLDLKRRLRRLNSVSQEVGKSESRVGSRGELGGRGGL
jgi:hypothetical protein